MDTSKQRYFEELWELDWSFRTVASDPLASVHWYPARFIPQVPGVLLGFLAEQEGRILDPFCGSGTTLLEARRRTLTCFGIDTNPVAVEISRAKGLSVSVASYRRFAARVEGRLADLAGRSDVLDLPHDDLADWYHPQTLTELLRLKAAIDDVESKYQPLASVIFSSMQRFMCSQENHWGWICDNVKPKRDSLIHKPVVDDFFSRMNAFAVNLSALPPTDDYVVECGAAHKVLAEIAGCSFDAIVTSPPYLGTIDYVRSQRLSLYWMGIDIDEAKADETGARFKRHRKEGRSQFLTELQLAFEQCFRVLQWGGTMALVMGESPAREPYLDDVARMLKELGFVLIADSWRPVTVQRSLSPSVRSERVSVWMKPH